ncbi:MAG: hypothetical protein ACTSVC_15880 [Promethearchaeota archaeon]
MSLDLQESILRKLNLLNFSSDHFLLFKSALNILVHELGISSINQLIDLKIPFLSPFEKFSQEERKFIDDYRMPNVLKDSRDSKTSKEPNDLHFLSLEQCRIAVQKQIPQKGRKKFAMYFTNNTALKIIDNILTKYVETPANYNNSKEDIKTMQFNDKSIVVCDPFMGSGKTLVQSIRSIGAHNIKAVVGIEPYFLSAFIAFVSIFKELNGDFHKIFIYNGDSFEIIFRLYKKRSKLDFYLSGSKSLPINNIANKNNKTLTQNLTESKKQDDTQAQISKGQQIQNIQKNYLLKFIKILKEVNLIVTNPPFTKWEYIEESNKKRLLEFLDTFGYNTYLERRDMGLQIYSLFLTDLILNNNGLIISVLPLSLFYTNGGRAFKKLLRQNYLVYGLIQSESISAFSDDSGFKEVILVAKKMKKIEKIEKMTLLQSSKGPKSSRNSRRTYNTFFITISQISKNNADSQPDYKSQPIDNSKIAKELDNLIYSMLYQDKNHLDYPKINSGPKELENRPIAADTTTRVNYIRYNLSKIPPFIDNNWSVLFNKDKIKDLLLKIIMEGLDSNTFGYWEHVIGSEHIVRGFEIYGSNFFFIPNKFWKIIEDNQNKNYIIISSQLSNTQNISLKISRKFLNHALTKPGLYYRSVIPKENTYCLSIPNIDISSLDKDLQKYINWAIENKITQSAINNFGKFWYSHIYKSLRTKRPFGHVFIGDKVDLGFKNRGVFANFSPQLLTASKNFYVLKDLNLELSKAIAAWLNSSLFIAILFLFSRKISNTWTRLLRDDYLQLPIINFNRFSQKELDEINSAFNSFINAQKLPPLWEQFNQNERFKLDLAIFKALGLDHPENMVRQLHTYLLSFKSKILQS